MSEKIKLLERGVNVHSIYWALLANPQLWNQHTARTESPNSPHHRLDDIWVRFGDEKDARSGLPHFAKWHESADVLGVKPFLRNLMHAVGGDIMGGVLITRIPPGATCKQHTDEGWHALHYQKYAVQITSAPGQKFCFDGEELETRPGDVFWFNNQHLHWVENQTNYERITMIACIK
jgi:quercetin dioxygenase-like cupin family protein